MSDNDPINSFISDWAATGGSELANTQSFVNGLCALIGVDPAKGSRPDDAHNDYVFERRVLEIPAAHWSRIQSALSAKRLLSPKEIGVLNIAAQMPSKIPTELQCGVLLAIADKAHAEGITTE